MQFLVLGEPAVSTQVELEPIDLLGQAQPTNVVIQFKYVQGDLTRGEIVPSCQPCGACPKDSYLQVPARTAATLDVLLLICVGHFISRWLPLAGCRTPPQKVRQPLPRRTGR